MEDPVPEAAGKPVMPFDATAVQLKVEPAMLLVSAIEVVLPEQIV